MEQFAMRQQAFSRARFAVAAAVTISLSAAAFAQTGTPSRSSTAGRLPTGEDAGPVRRLSIDDAVRFALEQNLGIEIERFNLQIQDLGVAQARSFWSPNLTSSIARNAADQPASSFLSGAADKVSNGQFSTTVGLNQLFPWGGSYSASWNSQRVTTTNEFSNFNPQLQSQAAFNYTQPLLRNFKIDQVRQQVLVGQKAREGSDIQLRSTIAQTTRNVKNAYWDLAYAIDNLAAQRQSLELAQRSLDDNEKRVRVGTMAPLDIVEAQAEVARNEESVIVAEAAITQAEDRLRALIFDPASPDFWKIRLEPTDVAPFQVQSVDLDTAVRNALGRRADVLLAKNSLEQSDVNIRYFRNQILPDVNAQANYGLVGLGGTQLVRGSGFPGPVIGTLDHGFGSVLGDLFTNKFPQWTVGVQVGYPIGASTAQANLARAKLQYSQAQAQIRNLELQVATQVRDAARQVQTNQKRVESARAARQLAERRLEAEEKKFAAGVSTTFFVFQAQRDLSQSRTAEIRAISDYSKSLVDFEAVQDVSLGGGAFVTTAGAGAVSTGSTAIIRQ
jgi:outer membrane protein